MISAQTLFCPSISVRDRGVRVAVSELCAVLSQVRMADREAISMHIILNGLICCVDYLIPRS